MKDWEEIFTEEDYPDEYVIDPKIKSPLSVLWYNLVYEFEDNYPAKMHPDFVRDMIKMYSKEKDTVWDGCCGSGTVPRIADQFGRLGIGSDVNPKAVDLAQRKHPNGNYFLQDARAVCEGDFENNEVAKPKLILSSLPFGLNIAGDKNHYSDENGDISNNTSYEKFFEGAKAIIQSYFDNLQPLGICILDARDRTKDGKLYDLINHFRNFALEIGFELIGRYTYFLMPYRTMTFKNRETKFVMPMVSAMDAIVLLKPENEKLM